MKINAMPTTRKIVHRAKSALPLTRVWLRSQFDFPNRSWSLPALENPEEAEFFLILFNRQFSAGGFSALYPSARNRFGSAARRAV